MLLGGLFMPKEITHWIIATNATTHIRDSYLKSVIQNNFAPYLVGAIAWDIPYYSSGKHSRIFTAKADELHIVNTRNGWKPIANLVRPYVDNETGAMPDFLFSLLMGCITHVIIDSRFHPLIYYFTGNYYDQNLKLRNEAVFRHRQMEAHLDLFFQETLNYTGPKCAKTLVNQIPDNILVEALARLYFDSDLNNKFEMTKECLRDYTMAQSVLHNQLVKYLYKLVGIVNNRARIKSALFYPGKVGAKYKYLFENNGQYHHPITGEVIKFSLSEIYNECIDDILLRFSELARSKVPSKIMQKILGFPAVSLETGNICADPSLMRYFSENLNPK